MDGWMYWDWDKGAMNYMYCSEIGAEFRAKNNAKLLFLNRFFGLRKGA